MPILHFEVNDKIPKPGVDLDASKISESIPTCFNAIAREGPAIPHPIIIAFFIF